MAVVDGGVAAARGVGVSYGAGTFVYGWTTKASLPNTRYWGHAEFINGFLYYFGGASGNGGLGTAVVKYDPSLNAWTAVTSLSAAKQGAAFGYINGKVYLITSTNLEYDPATGVSTLKASPPVAPASEASAVYNNKLYFMTGLTMRMYDPALNTYTTLAAESSIGSDGGACFGPDNKYHLFYGTTHRVYDPATNLWTSGTAIPSTTLGYPGCILNAGLIYLIGGYVSGGLNAVRTFDTLTNTWSTKANLPEARGYILKGVALGGGSLWVAGGFGSDVSATVNAFRAPEVDGGVASARGSGYAFDYVAGVGAALGGGVASAQGEVRFLAKQIHGGSLPVSGQRLLDYWAETSPPR